MFKLLRQSGRALVSNLHRYVEQPTLIRAVGVSPRYCNPGRHGFDRRLLTSSAETAFLPSVPAKSISSANRQTFANTLPVVCPGCGAFSQTVEPDAPGYYRENKAPPTRMKQDNEEEIFRQAMARLETPDSPPESVEEDSASGQEAAVISNSVPICHRCHNLIYQSKGHSILHPSMQSIQSIIEASPHKNNHIYHVVDAADFPMSLIPNLMSALKLPRLRTRNRRSKSLRYSHDRVAEVSFIITRSDLLAPKKEQVDRLMPYLQEVLRDALGRAGRHVRLGNVRCVSAERGWWTRNVKQEIWERGGAGWVVGKVNVGKSALFQVVFPKGRNKEAEEEAEEKLRAVRRASLPKDASGLGATGSVALEHEAPGGDVLSHIAGPPMGESMAADDTDINTDPLEDWTDTSEEIMLDEESLLPPAQPEVQYPRMPIVSSLPGTTASPIRIPFGNGKGELIDLPGVHRSSLETCIQAEHRKSLVMKSRVVPEQHSIKPGQSLLLGGIIRITPRSDELIFLAYPFTPLNPHVTANHKAIAIQTGRNDDGAPYAGTVSSIGTDAAQQEIQSAGTFKLEWNVTKRRTGPLTDKTAGKQKADNLPFIVYGADILVEGVGWVELVCQVRRRRKTVAVDAFGPDYGIDGPEETEVLPEVEVFTPQGKFIGIRRPMNAWVHGGPKKVAQHAKRARPRMSISMQRRKEGGRLGTQRTLLADP